MDAKELDKWINEFIDVIDTDLMYNIGIRSEIGSLIIDIVAKIRAEANG